MRRRTRHVGRVLQFSFSALALVLCSVLMNHTGYALGPLCEEIVAARDTCKAPIAFAGCLEAPYGFEFDTGYHPDFLPLRLKVFYYSSPGELDVKASGNVVASWEAAQAYPGNVLDVRFGAEGIQSESPWESDGGLRFGARYRYNVDMGWTNFKKSDYIPNIPHFDISWPCTTTVLPYAMDSEWDACATYWGRAGNLPCWLKIAQDPSQFPDTCDCAGAWSPSVDFGSCWKGQPDSSHKDTAGFVVKTKPTPAVGLGIGGGLGACVVLSLDGKSIVDSTSGDSITADTGYVQDFVEIPCSFAKATEGERVFHFTQGPFHYNADLMVKLVAKLEPHIVPCFAEMLKVTLMIGGAICPLIVPSPIATVSYPIPFTEMDATFSVPISDPEVCNIEPGSGTVEALETVEVTWNTSWGAPDSCDCRAEIRYHARASDSLPWEPWILIADTLNTGKVEWIVPLLYWHEAQIRVMFKDPADESLAVDVGGIFNIGFPDTASVPGDVELPTEFALLPPYPNPFSGGVTIEFTLPAATFVEVRIYDARGRLVRKVFNDAMPPGYRVVNWNGDNSLGHKVGAGIYFVAVDAGSRRLTRKIELLR